MLIECRYEVSLVHEKLQLDFVEIVVVLLLIFVCYLDKFVDLGVIHFNYLQGVNDKQLVNAVLRFFLAIGDHTALTVLLLFKKTLDRLESNLVVQAQPFHVCNRPP